MSNSNNPKAKNNSNYEKANEQSQSGNDINSKTISLQVNSTQGTEVVGKVQSVGELIDRKSEDEALRNIGDFNKVGFQCASGKPDVGMKRKLNESFSISSNEFSMIPQFSLLILMKGIESNEKRAGYSDFIIKFEFGKESKTILRHYHQLVILYKAVQETYPHATLATLPSVIMSEEITFVQSSVFLEQISQVLSTICSIGGIHDFLPYSAFWGFEFQKRRFITVQLEKSPIAEKILEEDPKEKEIRTSIERRVGEVQDFFSIILEFVKKLQFIQGSFIAMSSMNDFLINLFFIKSIVKLGRYFQNQDIPCYIKINYDQPMLENLDFSMLGKDRKTLKVSDFQKPLEDFYQSTKDQIHSSDGDSQAESNNSTGTSNDNNSSNDDKDNENTIENCVLELRKRVSYALQELISRVESLKYNLLDLSITMDKILGFINYVEDILDIFDESNLIPSSLGFRIESGTLDITPKNDYIRSNIYYYETYFVGRDHLIALSASSQIVVAIICESFQLDNFSKQTFEVATNKQISTQNDIRTSPFRFFVFTKDGIENYIYNITGKISTWKDKFAEILSIADPRFRGVDWSTCPIIIGESILLDYEKKDMRVTRKLKMGILLCKEGQTEEEEMFDNNDSTESFDHFLRGLGEIVELNNYVGFTGGLDNRGTNSTGTHSLVRRWKAPEDSGIFEVMFHVSTLLPFGEQYQNIAKKRHIGNDIVLLVFQEQGSKPFYSTTVKSNFIQIIILVRSIYLGNNQWAWRVNVSSAQDVPEFGPILPFPPIFYDRNKLCDWLIHKMINGELASYQNKTFSQQFKSTWKILVQELIVQIEMERKKSSKRKSAKK